MDPSEIEYREKVKIEKKRNRKLKQKQQKRALPDDNEQSLVFSPTSTFGSINQTAMPLTSFHNGLPKLMGVTPNAVHPTASMFCENMNLFSLLLKTVDCKNIQNLPQANDSATTESHNMIYSPLVLEWKKYIDSLTKPNFQNIPLNPISSLQAMISQAMSDKD